MIIDLPNTTTKQIETSLARVRESHSLATGRVLTLLVAVDEDSELLDDTFRAPSTCTRAGLRRPG